MTITVNSTADAMPILIEVQSMKYLYVSLFTMVVYDYALNLNNEMSLVWGYGTSHLTYCYAFLRYGGLLYALSPLLYSLPRVLSDKACGILLTFGTIYGTIAISTLQGIMAIRICAIYENSKKIVLFLGVTFIIIQLINISLTVVAVLPPYGNQLQDLILPGTRTCSANYSANPLSWIFASLVPNTDTFAFEIILVALLIYRTALYVKEVGNSQVLGINGLIMLLMGQGLLYFMTVIANMIFDTLYTIPFLANFLNSSAGTILQLVNYIMSFSLISMLGPWLILSIRQNHLAHVNGGSSLTGHTTSMVAFERPTTGFMGPEDAL